MKANSLQSMKKELRFFVGAIALTLWLNVVLPPVYGCILSILVIVYGGFVFDVTVSIITAIALSGAAYLNAIHNSSMQSFLSITLAYVVAVFLSVPFNKWWAKRKKSNRVVDFVNDEGESVFSTVIENLSEGIAVIERDTRKVLLANKEFRSMLQWNEFLRDTLTVYDFVNDTSEHIDQQFETLQKERTLHNVAAQYRTCDGSVIDVEHSLTVSEYKGRKVMIVFAHKISEQEQIRRTMEQERVLLRTLLDTIPDVVYAKDKESRFILVNKPQVEILGASSEHDVLGKTDHDFYPKEFADEYLHDEQRLIETGIPLLNKEESVITPEGEIHWFSTNKVPLHNSQGEIVGLVGTGRDITYLKKIENALRESEAYLRSLLDFLPVPFASIDVGGKVQFLNKQFLQTFGYGWEALSRIDDWFFLSISEEAIRMQMHQQWVSNVSAAQISASEPFVLEYEVRCKNGERRFIQMMTKVFQNGINLVFNDLTEQRRTEEALEKERNLLHTLIDNLPDRIFAKDKDARFTLNNKSHIRALGASSQEEVIGKTDFDFKPHNLAAISFADDRHVLTTGETLSAREERAKLPSGEWGWLLVTKVPLVDSKGTITGLVGISRDITELKSIEASLAHERNLLRTLIDSIPDRIYVKDNQSRFIINNKAHLLALGVSTQEEAYGKTDLDFRKPELVNPSLEDDQRVIETDAAIFNKEEQTTFPDGSIGWVLTTKVPLHDEKGQVIGLIGISRDITAQKQTNEVLKQERNLLRTLIDNIPDRIFVKDAECRFILNNKAHILALGGKTQEDVIGKTDFDFRPRELCEHYQKNDLNVILNGKSIINVEQPSYSADGTQGWQLSTKVPLLDSQNKIIGLVGISRDITRLKKVEQEREALIEELQHALASVKTLNGLLPICANCKKIRDDKGYWQAVENYVMNHSDATFTHGLCPECQKLLYPEYTKNKGSDNEEQK
ncbi:MAG TPA: PAS domain-containing protein [Bacteroidota bacterium]|nr:PAS domain-containing protein [Bacteroidota bacterium]